LIFASIQTEGGIDGLFYSISKDFVTEREKQKYFEMYVSQHF